jgi:hypothetical protein
MQRPARVNQIPGMLDRRITAAQIGCLAVTVAAIWTAGAWFVLPWSFAALLFLYGLQRWRSVGFRRELLRVAGEVWAQEYRDRLQAELARGATDTQARFLVGDVMDRCDFTRYGPPQVYLAAYEFLRSRGVMMGKAGRSTSRDVARR